VSEEDEEWKVKLTAMKNKKNHSPALINSLQAEQAQNNIMRNENEVPWTNKRVKTARKNKKKARNGNANNFLMNASIK